MLKQANCPLSSFLAFFSEAITFNSFTIMFRTSASNLITKCGQVQSLRRLSTSRTLLRPTMTVEVDGRGTGVIQNLTVTNTPLKFSTDTYKALGGQEGAPSPLAYALASLGSCTQVTGSITARDNGIKVGEWNVSVKGVLPTDVLVKGKQGNSNWESVVLNVEVQTDAERGTEDPRFQHFASEVERRCPITQLFKRSGVSVKSQWVSLPL